MKKDKEKLLYALAELCERVGQCLDNQISEIVWKEINEVHEDFEALIKNLIKESKE